MLRRPLAPGATPGAPLPAGDNARLPQSPRPHLTMECALLCLCALRAAGPGPPWGPAGLGRLAKAGATTEGRAAQRGRGRRPPRGAAHAVVSPFSFLQALQLCCFCCASVAVALASDSGSSGGSGLNNGSYLPYLWVFHHPTRASPLHFVPFYVRVRLVRIRRTS